MNNQADICPPRKYREALVQNGHGNPDGMPMVPVGFCFDILVLLVHFLQALEYLCRIICIRV